MNTGGTFRCGAQYPSGTAPQTRGRAPGAARQKKQLEADHGPGPALITHFLRAQSAVARLLKQHLRVRFERHGKPFPPVTRGREGAQIEVQPDGVSVQNDLGVGRK